MKQRLQFRIEIRYAFHFVIGFQLLADFCDNHKKYVVNLHAIYSGFNVFLVLCTVCEKVHWGLHGGILICDVLIVTAAISTSVIFVFLVLRWRMLVPIESKQKIYVDFVARLQKTLLQDLKKNQV